MTDFGFTLPFSTGKQAAHTFTQAAPTCSPELSEPIQNLGTRLDDVRPGKSQARWFHYNHQSSTFPLKR